MLEVGTQAPEFTLAAHTGETVTLSSLKGKHNVVLVFYPGDETPGCIKQLCEIRDNHGLFEKKNALVFGVNPGDSASHAAFVKNRNFPFPLLVDEGGKVAHAYQCDGTLSVTRTVYAIDMQGTVVFAQRGKPSPQEILTAL